MEQWEVVDQSAGSARISAAVDDDKTLFTLCLAGDDFHGGDLVLVKHTWFDGSFNDEEKHERYSLLRVERREFAWITDPINRTILRNKWWFCPNSDQIQAKDGRGYYLSPTDPGYFLALKEGYSWSTHLLHAHGQVLNMGIQLPPTGRDDPVEGRKFLETVLVPILQLAAERDRMQEEAERNKESLRAIGEIAGKQVDKARGKLLNALYSLLDSGGAVASAANAVLTAIDDILKICVGAVDRLPVPPDRLKPVREP